MSFGHIPRNRKWKNLILEPLGWMNLMRRMQAPFIMKALDLRPSDTVLDIGCGNGNFSIEIAKKAKKVVGLDLTMGRAHEAIRKVAPNAWFVRGNASALPFKDAVMDKVLLSSVLQMIEGDGAALRESRRILKDTGKIVISVPLEYVFLNKLLTANRYERFKSQLNKGFSVKGKGYYILPHLLDMLRENGMQVIGYEYAPKKLGSILYEILLFTNFKLGLRILGVKDFLFLPLGFVDRFLGSTSQGCEVIIEAEIMRGHH